MQFSLNGLNTLDKIDNSSKGYKPSGFRKARKQILKAFCYLDLSDFQEFDKHFKIVNTLKGEYKQPYFKNPSVKLANKGNLYDKNFLEARDPQPIDGIPSLLTSHYNSLVVTRALEALKRKIKKLVGNNQTPISLPQIDKVPIFDFLQSYMDQCRHNRFERLTLKGIVLEYLEVLEPLAEGELKTTFNSEGPLFKTLNRLRELLDFETKFSEEIDPDKKPPMPEGVIENACKVFEDINDKILNEWFTRCYKNKERIKDLPDYLREFFYFERDLVKGIESKRKPVLKEYKLSTLQTRTRLLNEIEKYFSNASEIVALGTQIVCICDRAKSGTRGECLKRMLGAIKTGISSNAREDEMLQLSDYDEILSREIDQFQKHITNRSKQPVVSNKDHNKKGYSLNYVGLRRWNSFTPELSFSVGGGYFIFLSDNKGKVLTGIAVDPGFDFIRNFFRQGFTLTDIDLVLLTHGHPDHIRDFPAIIELLHERGRLPGKEREHKIYSVMSLGCYQRLKDFIARPPYVFLFYDTFVLDIDRQELPLNFECSEKEERHLRLVESKNKNENNGNPKLEVKYFKAVHEDTSESNSYGYTLAFSHNGAKISLGFTGDSKWLLGYGDHFKDCDLICSHIGSIIDPTKKGKQLKDYEIVGQAERLIRIKNHPYLFGEILFLQDWKETLEKKSLILISEFGEEMKGMIRPDLIKRFNRINSKTGCWSDFTDIDKKKGRDKCGHSGKCEKNRHNLFTVPVDVGLRVSIPLETVDNESFYQKIYCCSCERFVEPEKIDYEVYSHEEAIFYICKTCKRSKSIDVRHTIYQKYHESGRELKKA